MIALVVASVMLMSALALLTCVVATSSSVTRKGSIVVSPATEASMVTVVDWGSSRCSLFVAAAIVDVVIVVMVVVVEATAICVASSSSEAAIFAAMDRVVTGPGLTSISPDSRRNRQIRDLRHIFPSRGLFLPFRAAVARVVINALHPKLGCFAAGVLSR